MDMMISTLMMDVVMRPEDDIDNDDVDNEAGR
jgi:hypothetical protein